MANTKIQWSRLKTLPTERPLPNGKNYIIENSDGSLSYYSVTSDGEPKFVRGISDSEKSKIDRLTPNELTKLEGLDTQEELDIKIESVENKIGLASGSVIPITGTELPKGSAIPSYITTTGKAELQGGGAGKTYTQAGETPITVSANSGRYAYYDKSTDIWIAGEEYLLPQVTGTDILQAEEIPKGKAVIDYIQGVEITELFPNANLPVRRYTNDTTFTDHADGYSQTSVEDGLKVEIPSSGTADVLFWINTKINNPYSFKVNIKLTDTSIVGGRIGFGIKDSLGNYRGYNISSVGVLYEVNKHTSTPLVSSILTYDVNDIISFEVLNDVLKIYKNDTLTYTYNIGYVDFNGDVCIVQRGFPRYIVNVDYKNDLVANKLKPLENEVSDINDSIEDINEDISNINSNLNTIIIDEKITLDYRNRAIRITDGAIVVPSTTELAEAMTEFYPVSEGDELYLSGKFSLSYGVVGYDDLGNRVSALMASNPTASVNIEIANDTKLVIPAGVTQLKGSTLDKITNPFKIRKFRNVDEIIDIKIKDNKSYIIFDKVSDLEFKLHVYYPNKKKFLTNNFERIIRYNDVGSVENLLTKDIWNPVDIYDGVQRIAQGNANFIYRNLYSLDENTHVGSSHGCEVQKYTKFFLDGKETKIEDLPNGTKIECSFFNMTFLSELYAANRTISIDSDNALPKLDVDNNPIIAENHYMSVDYFADGKIKMRNTLYVKRDGTKYATLDASMITGYRPYFNHVMINNSEGTVNKHEIVEGSLIVTPIDGSTIDLQENVYQYCDSVTQWGDEYKIKSTIYNLENSRQNKCNVKMYFSYPSPNWLKVYLYPDMVAENAEGNVSLARVFNNGDKIDVIVEREVIL